MSLKWGFVVAKIVDCRGLACPQPVVETKKAMSEAESLDTIQDTETARMNVSRMASKEGYTVEVEEGEDGIYLHLTRKAKVPAEAGAPSLAAEQHTGHTVVLIPSDTLGRGDEELGGILIRSFLHALQETEPLPQTVIFVNAGVRLTVKGSPVLDDLQALARRGVSLLACGTCLGHFELRDEIAVGEVSNMYTIAETLLGAGKVVSL